jgi:small-conductance mechanosensitive channel
MMSQFTYDLIKEGPVARSLIVLVSLMSGYLFGKMSSRAVERALGKTLDSHQVMVGKRVAFYGVFILATLTGLNEAGINLSVLVGAAGVASVAIGFASQTTMSNLISGIFMVIERPFQVGDIIKVASTTGEVSTLGLFSTILKTADNMMVRIPNETLMKSEIVNTTRYPLRRIEVQVGVSYSADIGVVRQMLLKTISSLEITRSEPAPNVLFKSFGDNAINLSVDLWVERERIFEATNVAAEAIKKTLEAAGVDLPFPQRTLGFIPDQKIRVEVVK